MGQAIIEVNEEIFQVLQRPFQLEAWQKALLLPDAFRVVDAHCNPLTNGNNHHYVTVESDLIPENTFAGQPGLRPVYAREKGKPVFLCRIEYVPTGQNLLRTEVK